MLLLIKQRGGADERRPSGGQHVASWGYLGALLGALEAVLGQCWAPLGALLGSLVDVLRLQEAIGSDSARRPKSMIFLRLVPGFGLLGGALEDSEGTLKRRGAVSGYLGTYWEPS